jgi:hypothetical protein
VVLRNQMRVDQGLDDVAEFVCVDALRWRPAILVGGVLLSFTLT